MTETIIMDAAAAVAIVTSVEDSLISPPEPMEVCSEPTSRPMMHVSLNSLRRSGDFCVDGVKRKCNLYHAIGLGSGKVLRLGMPVSTNNEPEQGWFLGVYMDKSGNGKATTKLLVVATSEKTLSLSDVSEMGMDTQLGVADADIEPPPERKTKLEELSDLWFANHTITKELAVPKTRKRGRTTPPPAAVEEKEEPTQAELESYESLKSKQMERDSGQKKVFVFVTPYNQLATFDKSWQSWTPRGKGWKVRLVAFVLNLKCVIRIHGEGTEVEGQRIGREGQGVGREGQRAGQAPPGARTTEEKQARCCSL